MTIDPALYEIWTICLDVALMTSNSNNDDNYLQACRPHRLLIRCSVECGVWPGCSYSNNHHVGRGMPCTRGKLLIWNLQTSVEVEIFLTIWTWWCVDESYGAPLWWWWWMTLVIFPDFLSFVEHRNNFQRIPGLRVELEWVWSIT